MTRLLDETARRATAYLDGLATRHVAPDPAAVAALDALDAPLPAGPGDPLATLALLDERVSPATMATAGPNFFGFVIGGVLPAALAANWLAAAWDQTSSLDRVTPGTARIEAVALRWLLELLGLPTGCAGAFVTGATMANFCALAAARHRVLANVGWDVEADGLIGAPPVTVAVGDEVHPTLVKALGMLGLGRRRVIRVPVDHQGRIRADALPRLDGPAILCGQAGNINSGAFDPLHALADHAAACGAWLHVDGAFGLWARAAPELAPLAAGVERADSCATDAHKWLNVPYDSGVAFVRDGDALRAAMAVTAEYLPTASERRNPSDTTPELSRRARGVEVWAALHSLGRTGVADLVTRCCALARRFADGLAAAGHEILNEVVLNQVTVVFGDAAATERVIAALQDDGTCWCGRTEWRGRVAMRISVSGWATTVADVDRALATMLRIAEAELKGTR